MCVLCACTHAISGSSMGVPRCACSAYCFPRRSSLVNCRTWRLSSGASSCATLAPSILMPPRSARGWPSLDFLLAEPLWPNAGQTPPTAIACDRVYVSCEDRACGWAPLCSWCSVHVPKLSKILPRNVGGVVATSLLSGGAPPYKLVCALKKHQCHQPETRRASPEK